MTMNIGEASSASGVSAQMIRYFESLGLFPEAVRPESGYRQYTDKEVSMLRFIRQSRDLGFYIEQIRELFGLWQNRSRPSRHEAALADAGLTLEIVGDAEGSFDTPLLQRALSNLIGNATRYAQRGSTVRVEIIRAPTDEVQLKVVNHGPTIGPDDLPRLFGHELQGRGGRRDRPAGAGRFRRANDRLSRALNNHGLAPGASPSTTLSSLIVSVE